MIANYAAIACDCEIVEFAEIAEIAEIAGVVCVQQGQIIQQASCSDVDRALAALLFQSQSYN